ncbi:ABC transporter permease [Actinoallomurus iriomotensis]|uniref:Transport permease protein n=1 Tax=Actinoallomurus iriomotensis TaxID=478107 RepID=A0A9W6VZZ1_9ACTN|nr:ABC transporter permease [Actinoallomurus iriomotensis]GLY91733.1 transport permease protein [Actinoallomurus iriomotensis]
MTPTTPAPALPRGPLDRMRWAVADGWTVTRRDLTHWARRPGAVIAGSVLFPIMIVLMFGYLFGGAMRTPGDGRYLEFLMPGMFAMTMVFGIGATLVSVSTDAARGVTDRFRSLPMAPSAVVVGRAAADMLNSALALAAMIACGLAVGWRARGGLGDALLAVVLLLLLRFAFVWVGVYLGLTFHRNPEAVTAVRTLEFPIGFLANAFVAPATMPGWLGAIAEWNPLSATISATRRLFGNPGWGGDSWIVHHALPMAVAWPLLIVAIFFPLSVRSFRRLRR